MNEEKCEKCSIQGCFNTLCTIYIKNGKNKVPNLLIHQSDEHLRRRIKKKLYESLFLSLYSPYICISKSNKHIKKCSLKLLNVYNMTAEHVLELQINGRLNEADQLYDCSQSLKALNSSAVDQVLLLLILLANELKSKPEEKKLKFKKLTEFNSSLFQSDSKAMHIDSGGIDQFGSHPGDYSFEVSSDVFNLQPGSHFEGSTPCLNQKLYKESQFSLATRLSLFGGLINSTVTSLDEHLSIPDLPIKFDDSSQELLFNRNDYSFKDEGFVELSNFTTPSESPEPVKQNDQYDLIDIWDSASNLGKILPSWEKTEEAPTSNKYISELGKKGFDCLYNIRISAVERIIGNPLKVHVISEEQLYRDSLHVLVGIPSESYSYLPVTCSLVPALNYRCSGYSTEAINGVMKKFAEVGTCYCRLTKFCLHHSQQPFSKLCGGLVLKAFVNAMNNVLYSYWSAIFITEGTDEFSVMELWHMFSKFGSQLQFLADLCLCSEAFERVERKQEKPKFPVGASLLSYLYSLCIHNSSTQQYQILLYLFKAVSVPYIKFISNWLFEGLCDDPYDEFFVKIDQQSLSYRDKQFWTHGFQLKHNKENIPLFLDSLAEDIFACGKAINLIKLVNIRHFLFDQPDAIPTIGITYSPSKLNSIEQDCKNYIKCVQESEEREKIKKEIQKLKQDEAWQAKINKEKQATKDTLVRLKELEENVRRTVQEKKNVLFQEIQNQFLAAIEERKKKKLQKLEEDKYWLDEMKKRNEREDHIHEKAREELLMFYENITLQADQREFHADWLIRRFKLSDKRLQFLQNQEEILKVNLNNMKSNISSDFENGNVDVTDSSVLVCNSNLETTKIKSSDFSDSPRVDQNADEMTTKKYDNFYDINDISPHGDSFKDVSLIYPGTSVAPLTQKTLHHQPYSQEISQAKELLYPNKIVNDNVTPLSESTERTEVKLFSYANEESAQYLENQSPIIKNVYQSEGEKTKNLLYSSEQLGAVKSSRGTVEEGSETYKTLYPNDNSEHQYTFSSSRGYKQEGSETKDLIYQSHEAFSSQVIVKPSSIQESIVEISKPNAVDYVENNCSKNVLYTSEKLPEAVESTRGTVVEGSDTYKVLYPTNGSNFQNTFSSSRGYKQEGSEMKDLIYQSSEVGTTLHNSVKTSSLKVSIAKKLPPVNAEMHTAISSDKLFEAPTTILQHLYPHRYPPLENQSLKTFRKFEPPTKIKELMYPTAVVQIMPTKQNLGELKREEVWMDSIVEPLQDNFQAMELDPQPYLFGDVNQSMGQGSSQFLIDSGDKDTDFINQLPLETIINSSLRTTIQTQVSLVNKAVVQYFIYDLDIEVHFDAFRKFLLLEDGEFGHSLCSQLFSKVSSGTKPRDFCNSIHLNNIVIEALRMSLYASRIKYSNQLAFSLKSLPEFFNVLEVSVLDFLELRYRVPWPCNIIVTENSITKYNKIFSFLLRLKKAGWSLQEVWLNLKKAGVSRKAASSPELRQLQLFRHEMQHFVNNLERYIVNQILHVSWREFQQDLRQKVHSLDDLHKCHVNYLNKIIFRSLLSKNAAPVYKLISDIFSLILKFEGRLRSSSWETDKQTGHVIHPLFSKLKSLHGTFKQCTEFLFSIISKLVRGGYQDHLDDLLLQVNFNDYYTTAVVKS